MNTPGTILRIPQITKRQWLRLLTHVFLIFGCFIMVFPLIWLVSSAFKPGNEIFQREFSLIGSRLTVQNFIDGWNINPTYYFGHFMMNTFLMVGLVVIGTIASSFVTAYAFARLQFKGRKPLFAFMLSTMMLPAQVTLIPKYLTFTAFGWINSYLPFVVPAFCATQSFHIYLLVQFIRGIPKELDSAAKIDGCDCFSIAFRIIAPLSKPAMFSVGIFTFMWTWDDYLNQLIYISSVDKFTVSLFLRSLMDITSSVAWGPLLACSLISLVPIIVMFFLAQPYFVQGIATSGLKG